MNTTRKSIALLSFLLIGIAMSCNLPISLIQGATKTPKLLITPATPTETKNVTQTFCPCSTQSTALLCPTGIATPTSPAEIATPTSPAEIATLTSPAESPTETVIPASPTRTPSPTFIPSTPTPVLDEIFHFCEDKKPFIFILINPSATYELKGEQVKTLTNGAKVIYVTNKDGTLGERVRCTDGGLKEDGRRILACVGTTMMNFEVSVCDPTRSGCTSYKLELMRCKVNCKALTQEKCERSPLACVWNETNDNCIAR